MNQNIFWGATLFVGAFMVGMRIYQLMREYNDDSRDGRWRE